jgi:hypothetical protein
VPAAATVRQHDCQHHRSNRPIHAPSSPGV